MAEGRPTISTHVLDVERGAPARGIPITLFWLEDGKPIRMTQALTDQDGRVADLLERPMQVGQYRLEFVLGQPGGRAGGEGAPASPLFTRVTVDLWIDDVRRSYHVPLLVAPYAVTTYRGS